MPDVRSASRERPLTSSMEHPVRQGATREATAGLYGHCVCGRVRDRGRRRKDAHDASRGLLWADCSCAGDTAEHALFECHGTEEDRDLCEMTAGPLTSESLMNAMLASPEKWEAISTLARRVTK